MSEPIFLDTNVLIYAVDAAHPEKHRRARHLMVSHAAQLMISTQVLVEYHAVCTSKLGLTASDIERDLSELSALRVLPTDSRSVTAAARLAAQAGLSIYDALIAEAAIRGGCRSLMTEDADLLSAELDLAVENPFA